MTGGIKRKRDGASAPKFYAVRVGRQPGIYSTWSECSASVNGFAKAIYKSFSSEADAQAYIHGNDVTTKPKPTKHTTGWYAVRQGRLPGVYSSWSEAEAQINGFKDAVYKKFDLQSAAEQYLAAGSFASPANEHAIGGDLLAPAAKKAKAVKGKLSKPEQLSAAEIDLSAYAPGEAPMPVEAEDGFDTSIILDVDSGELRYKTDEEHARLKPQAVRPVENAPTIIHTDGSTLGNGRDGAISGVGVYFGPADKRNISETLPGKKQTNQRAELTGLVRALELAPRDRRLVIRSDSKYAIQCVTTWFLGWRKNNWQTAARKAVDNKDLVVKAIDNLEERMRINKHRKDAGKPNGSDAQYWDRGPAGVRFEWLKGHSIHEGNQAADLLAVQGAQKARELDALTTDDIDI